ncbi:MAG: Mrp/NBP35 family ATP-binding protein [Pseudomonadota bacterium]
MFRKRVQKGAGLVAEIRKVLGMPDWLVDVSVSSDGTAALVIQPVPGDAAATEKRRLDSEAAARSIAGVVDALADVVEAGERGGPEARAAGDTPLTQPIAAPTHDKAAELLTDGPHGSKPGQRVTLISAPPKTERRRVERGARLSDEAIRQGALPQASQASAVPGISRILVVASAKGGVGKSTVAVNLAAALARTGMKVGLLDADIYGPSIPTMLGTQDRQPDAGSDGKLIPVSAHGMQTLSIGYLSDPDAPMIWRGPIVMSAIRQMLSDASWGDPGDPLDLLVMDTPPGTGDAQLAIAQNVPVTAAILVTTPQEVALADVRRGAAMFAKTHVPVLGIVESMSWFEDPSGTRHPIMGQGGGQAMARALGLPLLAQVPMLQAIREGGDRGVPAALAEGPAQALFHGLARDAAIAIDQLETKQPPEIVFEP